MPPLTRRDLLAAALLAGCRDRSDPRQAPPAPSALPASAAPSLAAPPAATAPATASAPAAGPLWRAFPALAAQVPRAPLGRTPTPLERAGPLAADAALAALWLKRDDLSSDVYGGGKTRKLEVLLGEALARGARSVVTFGGAGSNQAVATALHARRLGLGVELHLAPQPGGEWLRRNLLAARRAGATLRAVAGVAAAEAAARQAWRADPRRAPYVIPAGGSSPPGNLAFVDAALELGAQLAASGEAAPGRLYVAMGTMGSAVGLALGLKLLGLPTQVVAVRCSSRQAASEPALRAMAAATVAYARRLDPSFPALTLGPGEVRVAEGFLGAGYARPTAEGRRAIELAAARGLALEPTYTGKALAALLDDARRAPGSTAAFWHTHSSAPLPVDGVGARDLPAALQAYFT